MVTAYTILAAMAAGAAAELPLIHAAFLREAGCWLRWEGESPVAGGVAVVRMPNYLDPMTISVERIEGREWRAVDFAVGEASSTTSTTDRSTPAADAMFPLTVELQDKATSVNLRVQGFTTSAKWRPVYALELAGTGARLTLRAVITAHQAVGPARTMECVASTAAPRNLPNERWADATAYALSATRIGRGSTSHVLFSTSVEAEEFAAVELGAMAGEPGVRPAQDRVLSMLRLSNRTMKAWPTGELLVTREGRLVARAALPHVDAGQAAEIAMGTSVGVAVARDEVELERKTSLVRRETDPPDAIQTTGSATIANRTARTLTVRATKTVAGDATAASDEAKIVRAANRIGAEQPLSEIRWSFMLPAGQSKRLTYGTAIRLAAPSEAKDTRP